MGRNTVRAGAAVEPTLTVAGTDNSQTAPRLVTFNTPTRPILLAVPGAFTSAVRAKINAPVTNDFDNDTDDDGPGYFTIAPGETKDVSLEGQVAIQTVSFVTQDAGDDLDLVSVVGWPAGAS